MKAQSVSLAAHAAIILAVVACASAPNVVTRAHHVEPVVIVAPTQVPPAVHVVPLRTAKLSVPSQGSPARILLGHSTVLPRLAVAATTEAPAFGELQEKGQLALPATQQATVHGVKLVNFEQPPAKLLQVSQPVFARVQPVARPVVTFEVKPGYTESARAAGIQGEVVVGVIFHKDGTVQILGVYKGLGYGLDEAAQAAAKSIQFQPATQNGENVDFQTSVHITFQQ